MDCSTRGFPAHHQLPEFTQTHAIELVMPLRERALWAQAGAALRGEAATQTGRVGPARGWAPAGVDVPQVAAAGFSEDVCDDNTREAVERTRQGVPGSPCSAACLGLC